MAQRDLEPLMAAAGAALPAARLPGQIEYAGGELLLRGVELPPEELAAANQRLAADGYAARSQDGALLLRHRSAHEHIPTPRPGRGPAHALDGPGRARADPGPSCSPARP